MNCKKCNTLLNYDAKYCNHCGAQINNNGKVFKFRKKSSAISITILIILILLTFNQIVSLGQTEKDSYSKIKTFTTPKDAIEYYVDAVKKGDIQKMAEASGIDVVSNKFDFVSYSYKLRRIITNQGLLPTKYKQFIPMNRARVLNECYVSYEYILCNIKGINLGMGYPCETIKDAILFQDNEINPEYLKNITIIDIKDITDEKIKNSDSQRAKDYLNETAHGYGADELRFFNIELGCSDNSVSGSGIMVLRYGESWYLWPGSFLLN